MADHTGRSLSIDELVAHCRDTLAGLVAVETYEFASCYLWYDRPLYNDFGEEIRRLQGDTIYLQRDSDTPLRDLFHELGHVIGRHCRQVGNSENGYRGEWERRQRETHRRNRRAASLEALISIVSRKANETFTPTRRAKPGPNCSCCGTSYPFSEEAALLDPAMAALRENAAYQLVSRLAKSVGLARG